MMSTELIPEAPDLLPLTDAYMRDMSDLPKEWAVNHARNEVQGSWNITTKLSLPDGTPVATVQVQIAPHAFRLSWINVEEVFRGGNISSLLYQKISAFLTRECPDVHFSTNATNDITKNLTRKYFKILTERGPKFRGTPKPPTTDPHS
jgi:hypothetical protein